MLKFAYKKIIKERVKANANGIPVITRSATVETELRQAVRHAGSFTTLTRPESVSTPPYTNPAPRRAVECPGHAPQTSPPAA